MKSKTMKILIEADVEKLEELREIYISVLKRFLHITVQRGVSYETERYLYNLGRKEYPNFHSNHLCTIIKETKEMIKSCIEACKSNCRTRFPSVNEGHAIPLTSKTYKTQISEENIIFSIAYKAYGKGCKAEYIKVKLLPSTKQKEILLSLNKCNIYRIHGVKLLKREEKWWLYISIEKKITLPRWGDCKTFVGVDIGMNYLAVATAINENGLHKPLFISGKQWRHLQLQKRIKIAILSSRAQKNNCYHSKDLDAKWHYYSDRFDEILHSTAKQIVEYASKFEKPIIVLEKLNKMYSNSLNRKWNFLLGNWARSKLQIYIKYKAEWFNIPVVSIYPHHTSQICYRCGQKGERKGKLFYCSNCNKIINSDFNASINIALRFSKSIKHQFVKTGMNERQVPLIQSGASKLDTLSELSDELMKKPEVRLS
jgi:IS605 OrfB family transposase